MRGGLPDGSVVPHFPMQPGPGVGPEAVRRSRANAEDLGRVEDREAGEVPELHQFRGSAGRPGRVLQCLVEGDQVSRAGSGSGDRKFVQVVPLSLAAALLALLAAGAVDEDAAHGLGGGARRSGRGWRIRASSERKPDGFGTVG